jgi:hypothetical protein
MLKRRRIKQSQSLQDRLALFAKDARKQADELPPGSVKEDWLRKAGQADIAIHIDEWINSPGLQPPTR